MLCKVCGAECGRFVLCRECNDLKNEGKIVKCPVCRKWHYVTQPCDCADSNLKHHNKDSDGDMIKELVCTEDRDETVTTDTCIEDRFGQSQSTWHEEQTNESFLYDKKSVISYTEKSYMTCIQEQLPEGYQLLVQSNLATFIKKTNSSRYQNELFRNVDFLVTDMNYFPQFVIEINDRSHTTYLRRERDKKVHMICEEAGIPIITLWTNYGISGSYIGKRISDTIESLPVRRVHHFSGSESAETATQNLEVQTQQESFAQTPANSQRKRGCYIATCVYGSYDCPQVWTLRRFRDNILDKNVFGRFFIKVYYAVSPVLVNEFGNLTVFKRICKFLTDRLVKVLQKKGVDSSVYFDK